MKELNVQEIKEYNDRLREYKEKSSKIKAEIEFNTAELSRLCEELSVELGIEVTMDNLEEIYNDRVDKINNTLKVGKEILERIREEEEEHNLKTITENVKEIDNINTIDIANTVSGGDVGNLGNLDVIDTMNNRNIQI